MKKVQILLFLAVFNFAAVSAAADPKPETTSGKLRTQIINLLGVPELELNEDLLESTIQFMVTSKNTIVVLNVSTENPQLENYIKSRLNYKKAEIEITGNRIFHLPYKIKKG
ncbi:hypothetical protein [Leeuwenhoekiella aequorea]|uniref:Uncharacterized protein n=1 Tax=Leeuwenhoekiella aequorea TaxID=283736 RepID=A0A4Q0P6C2_9FLAO|nr:hypothetical protein [Leeuwenhoekiella aequorea]RXG21636.1 hypothetical protein DSM00_2485 [Leeuwenhoekiella aequorea]